MKVKSESEVAQLCITRSDPMGIDWEHLLEKGMPMHSSILRHTCYLIVSVGQEPEHSLAGSSAGLLCRYQSGLEAHLRPDRKSVV